MIIAIIPAKKDSNRMPDKNMRVLLGRPLLEYAIDYAKQSRRISRIYVSTDDMAIADFAESQGVKVVSRPEILGGETPLLDVYRHALNTMKLKAVETVAGVQADHPDRNISLDVALDKYEDEGFDCLYSKDANGHKNGAHSIMSDLPTIFSSSPGLNPPPGRTQSKSSMLILVPAERSFIATIDLRVDSMAFFSPS